MLHCDEVQQNLELGSQQYVGSQRQHTDIWFGSCFWIKAASILSRRFV